MEADAERVGAPRIAPRDEGVARKIALLTGQVPSKERVDTPHTDDMHACDMRADRRRGQVSPTRRPSLGAEVSVTRQITRVPATTRAALAAAVDETHGTA